jgi:polyribonucleotide nucleotidyltransferase
VEDLGDPQTGEWKVASGVSRTEVVFGDKQITFETGRLAKQASGAVVVRSGDTMVLVTAVVASTERNVDFFPLTVDVEAGMYAAGKITRRLHKKRRPGERPGDTECPAYRPAIQAFVAQGFQ